MEYCNILNDYFNMFRISEINNENNTSRIKIIDNILRILDNFKSRTSNAQYITDFDNIVEVVNKNDISDIYSDYFKNRQKNNNIINTINKGNDNIIYDVILNVIKYNNYLANKKVKSADIVLDTDISFDKLNVELNDILNYLEIKDGKIDKDLLSDLCNISDINKLKEFAIKIKTDNGMRRVLFDKIEDKNILIIILLHSNLEIVDNVIKIFENENANINKVVNNIPSIFIKDLISSKCKYNDIVTNYDNFIENYKLIKEKDIEFKKMLNQSLFFITDSNENRRLIDKLDSLEGQYGSF